MTAEVCEENETCDAEPPQIVQGSVADIARYMSYSQPADMRLEVALRKLPCIFKGQTSQHCILVESQSDYENSFAFSDPDGLNA